MCKNPDWGIWKVQLNITGAFAPGYIATCILWVAFLLKGGIDFMTAEEYRALLDVDFNNVKIEDLTDIRKIKIDKNQPQSKRQAQFLKQVGNPYMLRRGSMMIKVSFANNGLSMEQAFENLLLNVWKFVVEFQSDMCYDVFGIKILN